MPTDNELMTEAEAANFLRLVPETLRNWRSLRRGPAFVKVGRRALYRREAISKWIVSREVGGR
jgi:hypothetical protein